MKQINVYLEDVDYARKKGLRFPVGWREIIREGLESIEKRIGKKQSADSEEVKAA